MLALPAHRPYWNAGQYVREATGQFAAARGAGDVARMRHVYFESATLYTRTLDILARSVKNRHPDLAGAASLNLIALHRALALMHAQARDVVPLPIAARDAARERMVQNLILDVLEASGRSVRVAELERRVQEWELLGDIPLRRLEGALADLETHGVLVREGDRVRPVGGSLHPLNLDHEGLRAMLPDDEYQRLAALGFSGISEVAARSVRFREVTREALGWDPGISEAMVRACALIESYSAAFPAGVEHADLIHSTIPRPYQYEAFAVFRGLGYTGQVVEAPTGSGKTVIGMMCIQDWLARLNEGERILVLVPSQNYQRQWVRELCYLDTGLQLSPESVWAGAPAGLEQAARRCGRPPVVLVMTYAALADRVAEDLECDPSSGQSCPTVSAFLESQAVRHVLLDEVHKVAQRPGSPTSVMARALADWNRQCRIRSLIGFSGTAEAYARALADLGLSFAFKVPEVDTVAHGFVAPFGELAIPFAYSEREKQIHDALDAYNAALRRFLTALGPAVTRGRWAEIPLDRRLAALRALHPEATGKDAAALPGRALAAGRGTDPLSLRETWMVALLQALEGVSDSALADLAADSVAARAALSECRQIAGQVGQLVRLPSLASRLGILHGAPEDATPRLTSLLEGAGSREFRHAAARDALAVTVCGVALSFPEWYHQTGEGRVGAIRAALRAEQETRDFRSAIIFDAGRSIPWRHHPPAPGFAGVGGTFAELVRDPLPGVTPFAALSAEFYLPLDPPGLPDRIADWIRDRIMVEEIGSEIVEMAVRGLELPPGGHERLRAALRARLAEHAPVLRGRGRAARFRRAVLTPLRRALRELDLGGAREAVALRLSAHNRHLSGLVAAFYDYAALAEHFRAAQRREWVGTDGERRTCAVVPLPGGSRRQLMYEMAARIPDAAELGINVVIVSAWARTGWNVRQPNVLIDATATRNPTAWQQLRGRAMRALPQWTPACGRAASILMHATTHFPPAGGPGGDPDVAEAWRSFQAPGGAADHPDPEVARVFTSLVQPGEIELEGVIRGARPEAWTASDRARLLVRLLQRFNKVTHLYELLKCSGHSQVMKADGHWRRRPALELKHCREDSVNPVTGGYGSGAAHAPLIYARDPRADLPAELEATLTTVLQGADERIILGWVAAAGLN